MAYHLVRHIIELSMKWEVVFSVAVILLGTTFFLWSCGSSSDKGEDMPMVAPPVEASLAGRYLDDVLSEVIIFADAPGDKAVIQRMFLNFQNTYNGVEYAATIELTRWMLVDYVDASEIFTNKAIFHVSAMTTTTVMPIALIRYDSNYGPIGFHLAEVNITAAPGSIVVSVAFKGTENLYFNEYYFNRTFYLTKITQE